LPVPGHPLGQAAVFFQDAYLVGFFQVMETGIKVNAALLGGNLRHRIKTG
jgi:hypothetical protein